MKEQKFSIKAKTCTLIKNTAGIENAILNKGVNYIVPIYQRPYSWGDIELNRFIKDISSSFRNSEGEIINEAMFIGTMQLSAIKTDNTQEIIDGQQRITTMLILLKVLQLHYRGHETLEAININCISTEVNSGKQQEYLSNLLQADTVEYREEVGNKYVENYFKIESLLAKQDLLSLENEELKSFMQHLSEHIYFVVIETNAGLSKTLQIFDTINTTGLDLNGNDLFKIKMFEYLRKFKGADKEIFEDISKLYHDIDIKNAEHKRQVTSMTEILVIYQLILIAKYDLPTPLYSLNVNTFFERLFDTIFGINDWEGFGAKIKEVELSLDEMQRIIDVRYDWDNRSFPSVEDAGLHHLLGWSRYNRYWRLGFVYLFKHAKSENAFEKSCHFMSQLTKLYLIYSLRFAKVVNEMHRFTYELLKHLINDPTDEGVLQFIKNKIGKQDNNLGYREIVVAINGELTHSHKSKNILCRLSALLEEDIKNSDVKKIKEITKGLFDTAIDIEHIQSYHDKDKNRIEDVWKDWGEELNSIGNLVILESNINRSISNNPYSTKLGGYQSSQYQIVKNQASTYSEWDFDKALVRKEYEVNKLLKYLFS